MKTLILMRHAKSSWSALGLDDHDRPLNKRGRASAPVMARWLADNGIQPDHALCSTAQRVRETYGLMREEVPELPEPAFDEALYHALPEFLNGALRRLPPDCGTAMLVAHEPGLSSFVERLGGPDAPANCRRAYGHFPTAAMAVLRAEIERWDDLTPAATKFEDFALPRELMDRPDFPA